MSQKIDISVYYFPNYHEDSRNNVWHRKGWTEWEVLKNAVPRFEGHRQPKVPLWGYEDEADPSVMAKKIDCAADHGIDNFIFDWYWYNDGSFLERALREGFLGAPNNERLKFSLMWANHDWLDIHPADQPCSQKPHKILAAGEVDERAFVAATDRVIEDYFSRKNYYRIDGACYFSIYMPAGLVSGLGGLSESVRIIRGFRERAAAKGISLHLNAVMWSNQVLPGEKEVRRPCELMREMGFDSISSYVWIHHDWPSGFPAEDYGAYSRRCAETYRRLAEEYGSLYFPNVTVGWDSSPRVSPSAPFGDFGYPWSAVLTDDTPAKFEEALRDMKEYMEKEHKGHRMFTMNAWNEWTEGSYLEPDTEYGYGMVEAIKRVFER